MLLYHLFTDYVLTSSPSLSGFAVLLIWLQMILGAINPISTLISAVKRENPLESLLLSLVPILFFLTVAIVEPLLFGSFLGEGFQSTQALALFLGQPRFFLELLALLLLFLAVSLFYLSITSRQQPLTLSSLILTFGAEAAAAFVCLAGCLSGLLWEGQWIRESSGSFLKWFVYGIFLLVNKTALLFTAALWSLLFSESKNRVSQYFRDDMDRIKSLLCRRSRPLGLGIFLFSLFYAAVVLVPLYREGGFTGIFVFFSLLGLLVFLLGLIPLLLSFLPRLSASYRLFLRPMAGPSLCRLFCSEYFEDPPLYKTLSLTLTKNFLVLSGFPSRIYYLGNLETIRAARRGHLLSFQEGRRLLLEPYPKGSRQVLDYLNDYLAKKQGQNI